MPTTKGRFAAAYRAGFGSIIAFSAYVWLLHHVRPTLAGSYASVNPVVAVVLGAWLAAERFSAHDLGPMAVILLGVVAITLSRARAPNAAPAEGGSPPRRPDRENVESGTRGEGLGSVGGSRVLTKKKH